jgi:hypothetical protein
LRLRTGSGPATNVLGGGTYALLGLMLLAAGCNDPKDARLRARENRSSAALETAVHRETRARIRSVACVRTGRLTEVCRVSFHGGRPAERWRLVYTRTSARAQRIDSARASNRRG